MRLPPVAVNPLEAAIVILSVDVEVDGYFLSVLGVSWRPQKLYRRPLA